MTSNITTETLIIGAGPAGMAAAMELSKAGKSFILVEKESQVGGLSKTYTFTEPDGSVFHTDNGPHRFFSKNPYLYEFIGDLLKENWIKVRRQTRQFIDGKFYDYPINAIQALRNVGFIKASRMLIDYAIAKFKFTFFRRPIVTFEDYVVAHFGRTLGEFNMINYTEKIWGIPASTIHPDWAQQRIKGLNLKTVLKDTFLRLISHSENKPKSLVDEFYYPREGTGQIYNSIKTKLEKDGYEIWTNTYPIKVAPVEHGFRTTLVRAGGEEVVVESRYLVESVPILDFVTLIEGSEGHGLEAAASRLRYRSQVYLFVTLDRPSLTLDQWIYFPAKDVPIARVSEMKNFSDYMSPTDKTSLFVEFFCFEGDDVWNMDTEALAAYALPHLERAGLFTRRDVRAYYRLQQRNVYPIYDLEYKTYLATIRNYLDSIPNLFYIGRPGRFRYNNQDHSLEMGIMAARSIIEGKRYDIEAVGAENEYFEKGSVPPQSSNHVSKN
jgi:protoporphyrinogen oxidase